MIEQNIDLKPFNTFGISAKATEFARFKTVEELSQILENHSTEKPLLILGGGSNLLLTKDFGGLVLKNEIEGIEILNPHEDTVLIKAGAGENWHEFVLKTIDLGLGGLENLSLIPGNVGASPMQNIGAYGREVKDVFHSLEAFHIATGEVHTFTNEECEFGYRESVFKRKLRNQYIILSVTYQLSRKHEINISYGIISQQLASMGITTPTIKDVSDAVIAIRRSKLPDPKEIGNAGSFFKNPVIPKAQFDELQNRYEDLSSYPAQDGYVKIAAGWLIEKAGWKGKTFGAYGVHKLQALVLVNYGEATGTEIYNLSQSIIEDIEEKFGITLEREVNIL